MDIKELYELYKKHPIITTDSRQCPEGSIFLALKGESFNGNKFAVQALEKGCAYAIVDEDVAPANPKIIIVEDCLQTFKDLAREHRRQFNIPVIGITGTNGKTTTKELIATVLGEKYNVLYTQGNFNNDVGVPKTLFRLTEEHEIAVIEMGASHPGDIKTLVETVEPTCGLITNVGRAHLQGFGSFEGVMKTKGELYDFLGDRTVFLDADNEHLVRMAKERNLKHVITYGSEVGRVTSCNPFVNFEWTHGDVHTHLIGAYNISNILAAITVGLHFGVTPEQINHAIENYVPSNNRSQLTVTEHNQLVVDAYNANPTSMAAAIENFRLMEVAPKMAIIGVMGELGDVSREEHMKVGEQLRRAAFDRVWLVGEEWKAENGAWSAESGWQWFATTDDVIEALRHDCPEGYYILIKGSHSNHLDRLVEEL